ncbi:MAG TPA: TonB-dependent receptor, partial [Polyangia bacterium]|nr:TonB-dependent receptor [Polyangia bacterium]
MNWKVNLALRLALAAGLAATAIARAAHGQEPAAAAPAASALTPPKLKTFVPAEIPDAAKKAHREGVVDVELDLTIDATGAVTSAVVATPAGDGFDEAAVAAARQFVFEPARRGEKAIPSRIKYRYVFDVPPEAPPAPTTGNLEGKVLLRGAADAVANAVVTLSSSDGQVVKTATSDASGAFTFADLPPGHYHLKLSSPTLETLTSDEEITAGDLTTVTYRLEPVAAAPTGGAPLEFGATATIEAPPREVTKRSLSAGELLRVAGTRGDPLRAIEYMPGVGRAPQANFVIIRGSSPADSEVQFEGAPVFRLYHFGGLTSFVQPRLLDKIDLYPGNFSARYGRKMGGIVDVTVRDPKTDGFHGMVDVNIIDASFLAEGPLTKTLSFAVAAKRSYLDAFIDHVIPKDEIQILAAPVYWDYQAMLVYKPSENDKFRAMVYGSYDDFKLILADPDEADPAIRGGLSSYSGFQRGSLSWQHKYSADVEHEINLTAGPFAFGQKVGPGLVLDVPGYDGYLRAEWRARLHDRLRVIGGLDIAELWFDGNYNGPAIRQFDGDPDTFGSLTNMNNIAFKTTYNYFRPAGYVEAVWQPTDRLTVVPGARLDYMGEIKATTFDPRLTARYQLNERTTLKGGVGLFSQEPDLGEVLPVIGNPHLRPPRAQHYSLGVEQLVGERLKVTLEGFYKRLSQLTVNSPVPGENLNNDGVGRIYGAETSARLRPTDKSSGFLSYTLSRSERNDHGTEWRLFNWDQTHILTVAGAYRLGRNWDLSGTFRYVTGNPLTPVVATVYNANTDT